MSIYKSITLIVILFTNISVFCQNISPKDTTICIGNSVQYRTNLIIINKNNNSVNPLIIQTLKDSTLKIRLFKNTNRTELITNGDFESGNNYFYSEYIFCADANVAHDDPTSIWSEGTYTVDVDASVYHSDFHKIKDQPGQIEGNKLIVNGAVKDNIVIWKQEITIEKDKYYIFKTFGASLTDFNTAKLQFSIKNQLLGEVFELNPGTDAKEFALVWKSDIAGKVNISLVNKNIGNSGNDYALDNISFKEGIVIEETVKINVVKSPRVDVVDKIMVCDNNKVELNAITTNAASIKWISRGDGKLENNTKDKATYLPGINDKKNKGIYIVAEVISKEKVCNLFRDSIRLVIQESKVKLKDKWTFCEGNTLNILSTDIGYAYSWTKNDKEIGNQQQQTFDQGGDYKLKINFDNQSKCFAEKEFNIEEFKKPEVHWPTDTLRIAQGSTYNLKAGDDLQKYFWSENSEITSSILISKPGKYEVQVTNSDGCTTTAIRYIEYILRSMVLPNAFTPDMGTSNTFHPFIKQQVNRFKMYIYNRWGQLVYKLEKDTMEPDEIEGLAWDGTFEGNKCASGAYVCVIHFNNKEQARSSLILIR